MKTALATLCDSNFMPGFTAFIKSLLTWHSDIDYDFVVIDVGLTEENKEIMLDLYPNIIFKTPALVKYKGADMSRTPESLQKTYYTIDVFNIKGYDRVIFFDMDMVIMGDISEILNCKSDFAAVKGYNPKLDILREDFNSGMFVIGKKYLNEETYRDLLNIIKRGHSMPDQKALNSYFKGKTDFFNKRYNAEKRMITTKQYKKITDDIRVLHFVAGKPWNEIKPEDEIFEPYHKIWRGYFNK